jgi:hypothetical protein
MAATLQLNCWVFSDNDSQVFPIKICNTESVSILKKAIRNEKVALQHINADSLTLWKVSTPMGHRLQQNLASEHILQSRNHANGMLIYLMNESFLQQAHAS